MNEENIVKATAKRLNMTYKQLGELIGVSEGTIKQNAVRDDISDQITKACELLVENQELKAQIAKTQTLKETLQELLK
jgi:hypothetical protein